MPIALILTAIREETQAVRKHIKNCKQYTSSSTEINMEGRVYQKGEFEGWQVFSAETGRGNFRATLFTVNAINFLNPDIIIFVGIAGTIASKLKVKDVIVGEKIVYYGYSKEKPDGKSVITFDFKPSKFLLDLAKDIGGDDSWKNRIDPNIINLENKDSLKVEVEPIASADILVDDPESDNYKELKEKRKDVYAVDMESAGFGAAASQYGRVHDIVIRGISDNPETSGGGRRDEDKKIAAANASAFAFELLSKFIRSDEGKKIKNKKSRILLEVFSWPKMISIIILTIIVSIIRCPFIPLIENDSGNKFPLFGLNFFELPLLDETLRRREKEQEDHFISVIKVTENDLKNPQYASIQGDDNLKSLTDETVVKILERLQQINPKVIGLDIVRDKVIGAIQTSEEIKNQQHIELIKLLSDSEKNSKIVSVCEIEEGDDGIFLSQPGDKDLIPENKLFSEINLGFIDFSEDGKPEDANGIIRRQILGLPKTENCNTPVSLSLQLAIKYYDGVDELIFNERGDLKIGTDSKTNQSAVIRSLVLDGGHKKFQEEVGYQTFINYRDHDDPTTEEVEQPFKAISVSDFLNSDLEALTDSFEGDIVLIGYETNDDGWTPYGEMPGIFIHAHMTSQLIHAVEKGRPLLRVLPRWLDYIVIFSSALIVYFTTFYFDKLIKSKVNEEKSGWLINISRATFFVFSVSFWFVVFPTFISLPFATLILRTTGYWLPVVPVMIPSLFAPVCVYFFEPKIAGFFQNKR